MAAAKAEDRLFEAFFWLQSSRPNENSPFQPKVIWHSPENVAHITKEHRDIPSFCFPDMNRLQIEKAENCTSEYFVFTLHGQDGSRYYGFCYRNLFRGVSRRFDVGRRSRHCLCIVSRHPHFAFFKSLLMHIFGVALMERYLGQCKAYSQSLLDTLNAVSSNSTTHFPVSEPSFLQATSPLLNDPRVVNIVPQVFWSLPRAGRTPYRDVTLLPLFERLGVEKFFKVFSAALCECRLLFVSEDVRLLSTTLLSAAAMLHPFSWNHIFITVLPHKLLSLVSTSSPYLVGLPRQSYGALSPDQLRGVLVVELDTGDVFPSGDCPVKDLVGDAGNALKQASEGFDRMRAGLSSLLAGGKSAGTDPRDAAAPTPAGGGGGDLMAMLLLDLKSVLARRPGTASLQSVASGLLRGLPGATTRTVAESKAQWALEAEKALRDALATFFVYLFADLDDFLVFSPPEGPPPLHATHDVRTRFDLRAFLSRKRAAGVAKPLQDFLMEFAHAHMFEAFVSRRLQREATAVSGAGGGAPRARRASSAARGAGGDAAEDLFSAACAELAARGLALTPSQAKHCVQLRSAALAAEDADGVCAGVGVGMGASSSSSSSSSSWDPAAGPSPGNPRMYTGQFHAVTLQLTQGTDPDLPALLASSPCLSSVPSIAALDRILADSFHAAHQRRIFATLHYRLQTCRAAGSRGLAAVQGCTALVVLHRVLVQGQVSALAAGLDLLPLVRCLLRGKAAPPALDFLPSGAGGGGGGGGAGGDPRPYAATVFDLLVDHKKLLVQRLHLAVGRARQGGGEKGEALRVGGGGGGGGEAAARHLPRLADLHTLCNGLRLPTLAVGQVRCSEPERVCAEREEGREDGEDEEEEDEAVLPAAPAVSATSAGSGKLTVRIKPATPPPVSPCPSPPPPPPAAPSGEANLLDLDGGLVDVDAKYRAVNKDTGEVWDLRKFEEKDAPLPFPYTTPATVTPTAAMRLKPPPNDRAGPRRRPAQAEGAGSENDSIRPAAASTASFDFLDLFSSPSTTGSASGSTSQTAHSQAGSPRTASANTAASAASAASAAGRTTSWGNFSTAFGGSPPPNPFSTAPTSQSSAMGAMAAGRPGAQPAILTQRPQGSTYKAPPKDPFASLVDFK